MVVNNPFLNESLQGAVYRNPVETGAAFLLNICMRQCTVVHQEQLQYF